jgi:hypothetical protein
MTLQTNFRLGVVIGSTPGLCKPPGLKFDFFVDYFTIYKMRTSTQEPNPY